MQLLRYSDDSAAFSIDNAGLTSHAEPNPQPGQESDLNETGRAHASADCRVTFAGPEVERLLGLRVENLLGQDYRNFVHPRDLPGVAGAMEVLALTGRSQTVELRVRHRSGRWICLEGTLTALPQAGGDQAQTVFDWRDVTQRREDAERLRTIEGRLREIISHSPTVVTEFDSDGVVVMAEGHGAGSSAMVGRRIFELFADAPAVLDTTARILGGETVNTRIEVDGRWFEVWGRPVRAHDGSIAGGISINNDITHRVRAEQRLELEQEKFRVELSRARDAALESSRLKSTFLANMSHEVRSPLNVILGYVDVIRDYFVDLEDDSQLEYLEAMARAGKRLLRTIDGLLDYSKIETGAFKWKTEILSPAELAARQIEEFTLIAQRKGVELRFLDEAPGAHIVADEYSVSSALHNLLSNALKFTERGSIGVRLFRVDGELGLEVRDTGVGIEERFLSKLFQPFVQEDSAFNRKFEGTGLGLALTKRFLEANHAGITVTSEKGVGTIFTIRFPEYLAVDKTGQPSHDAASDDARIARPKLLLVEDDLDTQKLMHTLLDSTFEVQIAATGNEVRNIVGNAPSIDGVLMDISPRGTEEGLRLTRYIRSHARFRAIPIVAVTAQGSVEEQRLVLEAGCNAVLTKPLRRCDILSTLGMAKNTGPIALAR